MCKSCDVALFGTAYISKSAVNHKSFPIFSFLSLLILLLLNNFRIFEYLLLLPSLLLLLPPLNNFRIFRHLLLLPSLLLLLSLNHFRIFEYLLLIFAFLTICSHGPQQKSKAKVPKPPRGSGLNPSGEPAIDQLRIPTEQPQMSYFAFDAHETISQHGHYSGTQSTGFDDQSTSQHGHYSGTQSAGFDDQSTSQHGHSYSSTQSTGFDDQSTSQHGHYSGTQSTGFNDQSTSQHGHSYSSTQSAGFNDQSTWDFVQNQPSLEAPSQGSYPKHYSQDSFQGLTGSMASTSMLDTTLIQQGEIPQTDVMHMVGPARLAKRRGGQRPMPPTPQMAPYPTTRPQTTESSTSQIVMLSTHTDPTPANIIVTDATIGQMMKGAMKVVTRELFSLNAMTIDKALKKAMLTKVIRGSLLQCFGPNTMIQNFITSKHQSEVANTLSVTHGKDGRIEIKAKFQHPFIMSNIIQFIWFSLCQQFLGKMEEEQLERLKYIWALSGAATFCSLDEQSEVPVQVDPFGGMSGNWKFLAIVKAMDDLMDDEKAEFCRFLLYVLLIGPTQAPSS
ncbi:uncharacterized protein F5891DRAFT_1182923 [Suillus fuscotomentosus]|uniref:Uncharacterized protein n=1 Tax=Suillus fuscotomentosus TaxID=1912939 RepID=A0AAD4EGW9_9AGAM|nr:uncharacterized protein F5891DRAFT_1182923 [Suillus fuscotomentosus]KAG1905856.1 hypothetical protein F5891DRAFT_1182923 [Suillus fuscotomentosus]